DASCVLSNFNAELLGKMFVVFEELPALNSSDWHRFSNKLKNIVTGSNLNINQKGKDMFDVENTLSVMVCTNNEALKISSDDRRTMVLDVSHEMVGKFDYFKELLKYTKDDIVGEAFFMYCREHSKNIGKWNEFNIPLTENKT